MSQTTAPTVLFLVNKDTTVLRFRLPLLISLREAGYRVAVALPEGERVAEIAAVGAEIIPTPMKKDRITPLSDLTLLRRYRAIIETVSPAVILTYTVKPNLLGGLAAKGRVPLIATVTGRGRALGGGQPLRGLCTVLMRHALGEAAAVCFQNEADRAYFADHRMALGRHLTVPGSGVDLAHFSPLPYPSGREGMALAFISRLLPEKGLDLYIEVARRLRLRDPRSVFHVAGFGDAKTEARMQELSRRGVVVFHGQLRDIRPLLLRSHAVIHPTSYPEGMANILLEAAASGRPVITTNRPGCREAVRDGVSGYLIPERDVDALEHAVERFLNLSDPERKAMGEAGRRLVERNFDRRKVVAEYMSLIRACAEPPHGAPDLPHEQMTSPLA